MISIAAIALRLADGIGLVRLLIHILSPLFILLRSFTVRKRDMVKVAIATTGTTVGLVALPTSAEAVTFDLSDFSDTSSLTFNGSATVVDNVLQLTPELQSQRGSAFLSNPFSITADTSFSTRFDFSITGEGDDNFGSGDGFTFMVHNDPRGSNALGVGGGGLGYSGISPSVAVEFDTYVNSAVGDPGSVHGSSSNDHVGINTNGSVRSLNLITLPESFNFDQAGTFTANINYNGLTNLLDIIIANDEAPLQQLSSTIDLFDLVGSQAYFGFSAGTGSATNTHSILNWTLDTDVSPVPQPTERTFEFSGTFGEDVFDTFETFNGDTFAGSFSFFTNTPDLNNAVGRGTYALTDVKLTIFDDESGDETDLIFGETTEAFIDLDSYILRVRPARVIRRRAPRRTSFALPLTANENSNSQTCTADTEPDWASFVLTFDDNLENPDVPPTRPPQGNLVPSQSFFEFFGELSGPDDLCLIDRVEVVEVDVTDPDAEPEPVPEPGTALGLGVLGLGWGLRKRFGRAKG
ncbi:PEP-CTERM sorting domain-containing protein [Leptolyngbya sp. FACHB-541]|uniref:L-type lectin-domain containing protein n=1 Tax=Leptolyngbya sp. FACHB-541 TaxID=2692810 RepID=UPI001682B4AE|nr:L-type lectin-domain containing protein [Leptolyngbya sp. FACHB-541]MBD1999373.1 PEP-CTERM sorting domain-containing protein [Leptolyngbya sp. FACHB-541]